MEFNEIIFEIENNPTKIDFTNCLIEQYKKERKIKTSCWMVRILKDYQANMFKKNKKKEEFKNV